MSYIGRTGKLSQRAYNKVSFLATAGQTIKTGLSYVAGFVEVYLNGVLLTDTVDYTATNGNSVTFVLALNLDDEITIVSLKTFSVANMLPLSGGTIAGDLGVSGGAIVDGNLLVGKTAPDAAVAGSELKADGTAVFSRSSTSPTMYVSTLGSDGDLISFRKDSVTVGSIETVDGDLLIHSAAAGHKGLRLGNGYIAGTDNVGSIADNTVDLGISTHRFKDLYLSGGVYLGGTGAANKLDDYEEGTWTPTGSGVTVPYTCHYTKIGRQVHCKGYVGTTVNVSRFGGLPFTFTGSTGARSSGTAAWNNFTSNVMSVLHDGTGTNFTFYVGSTVQTITAGKAIYFDLTYFTNE